MNALASEALTGTGVKLIIERISEMGMPWWCFDRAMHLLEMSSKQEAYADDRVPDAVARAANAARSEHMAMRRFADDGVDLLTFSYPGAVVVVDLSEAAWSFASSERCARVLEHSFNDLNRIAEDQRAIGGFNAQLSQSYEEVNLIYRMARLLTSGNEPAAVVQTMGDELREVLGYGWVAIALDEAPVVLSSLRGLTTISGDLPFAKSNFITAVENARAAGDSKVLVPGKNSLADLARSEVLLESVLHDGAVIGALVAGNRQGDDTDVGSNEIQLVNAAAGYLGLFHQNAYRFAQQRQQFLGTLHALSAAVDAKDPYTQGHSQRVGLLASQMAGKLGFDAEVIERFRVAGLLHDIGKIGVPEAILRKPTRLTDEEFDLVKQHPETGYRILKDLPSLQFHIQGVLHHHERWDGRGYPHRLAGDQIPLLARVLALADTFDAMSSNRSYRNGMPRSRVLDEIRASAGSQFDPALMEIFIGLDFEAFDELFEARKNPA
jgi:putative nucleotidyltransferase with HDIG domain